MGLCCGLYLQPKYEGVPYHELDEEKQKKVDEKLTDMNYERKELWHCDGNRDMFQFLKQHAKAVASDETQIYLCMDGDVLENIMKKAKESIDNILDTSDRYDFKTYERGNPLYTWSELYAVLKEFQKTHNQQEWCLLVDAGW